MESLDIHDLTAAYALDALDADEAREYEAHLAHCERCRRELAELGETASALAYAAEAPAPPESLRARILAQALAERGANVVPLRPRWASAPRIAAAVAACAAIVLGIWAVTLSRSLDSERAARARADQALAILSDPQATRTALSGRRGALVVSPSGEAALVVAHLPSAPRGKTYEAWVIAAGRPARAGTFAGGGRTTVLQLGQPVTSGATVAVTLERRGGVDAPSGEPILTAKPA